jgi:hypothetical protein
VSQVTSRLFRVLETLDAAAVRRWCGCGLAALRAHQHEIDDLNVYPVPDGDTGTNLVLTLASAHQALMLDLDSSPEGGHIPLGHALRLMARGALLGARGNSGVIVSQILRGLADGLAGAVPVRGGDLAAALRSATTAAYAAVAQPVEGTVLSVVAAAADGASRTGSDDLLVVARAAASAAAEALARTPQQLPVLARAGVVDAGGRGLCLLLDALVEALGGGPARPLPAPAVAGSRGPATVAREAGSRGPATVVREAGSADYAYEVQYLLDADEAAVGVLRQRLGTLGDSLVVVGTGDGRPPTWNVHVHVNDVGAAIESGVEAGRPHRITVTRFDDQVAGAAAGGAPSPARGTAAPHRAETGAGPAAGGAPQQADGVPVAGDGHGVDRRTSVDDDGRGLGSLASAEDDGHGVDPRARAAVVMAGGEGLAALFRAEGATVVGANPSTAELLDAIRSTGAGRVVLLPDDSNTHAVASAAAREARTGQVQVSVVPTRSPVQALAALAVRDPARPFSDDVIAMAEAAGACRYAEVCYASREALTVAGRCRPGDVLGLVDGEVNLIGTDLTQLSRDLLDRMLGGGGELVTLLLGAGAPAVLTDALRGHLAQAWPFVEVNTYDGGQPFYPLLVGVE